MRQIVQLDRPIVQETDRAWPLTAGIAGRADACAWRGGRTQVEWNLSNAIGFLLVTADELEAQCAAGNKTRLRKGDLLILNEAPAPYTTFLLSESGDAEQPVAPARRANERNRIRALHGSIQPMSQTMNGRWEGKPFANAPAWSMAVARLSEREFARSAALGQLLADETSANDATYENNVANTARLVGNLESTLFDALAGVLWSRDPMSLPQLAACGDKRLAKALVAMTAEPGKPWRIESMAREAAMSRTAFAMRFKEVLGQTPLDYLTALRIQHALTVMETEPQQSIDSVARDVGYADESALRRAYLRATGEPLRRGNPPLAH
jgi:AraC-like DNA-binding protein